MGFEYDAFYWQVAVFVPFSCFCAPSPDKAIPIGFPLADRPYGNRGLKSTLVAGSVLCALGYLLLLGCGECGESLAGSYSGLFHGGVSGGLGNHLPSHAPTA
jgi:hypothetical protein